MEELGGCAKRIASVVTCRSKHSGVSRTRVIVTADLPGALAIAWQLTGATAFEHGSDLVDQRMLFCPFYRRGH